MPELGKKHDCPSCGTKFYDLGKPEPICPKCGTNLKHVVREEPLSASQAARRRRKAEMIDEAEEVDTETPDATDEILEGDAPEGLDDEEEEADLADLDD